MTTIHGRLDEVFDLENKRMPLPVKLADLVEQLSIVSDDIASSNGPPAASRDEL